MGIIFHKYKKMITEFIGKEKLFLFLLTITCVASYGFTITNFSIGIDDTSVERYIHGGELLSQGRFGDVLLDKIFGVMRVMPFWVDFLAVIILAFAAIIWSILFNSVANGKIKRSALITFATIFVSYPIINEIFIYMPASLSICIGYMLTGLALVFSYEFINMKKVSVAIISALLMCLAISIYESFAAVYICGFFALLIIRYYFTEGGHESFWTNILHVVRCCAILLFTIVLNLVISNFLIKILDLTRSYNAQNSILWFHKDQTSTIISNYIIDFQKCFGFDAMQYKPILILFITGIFTLLLTIGLILKFKSFTPVILMIGMAISNFLLSIIQGAVSPYRTCQSFAISIGFVWMLYAIFLKGKYKKVILYTFIFLLVLNQTKDLNEWFYNDYRRFEIDKTNIIQIAQTIQSNYGRDISKPVVFIGNPGVYNNVARNQTNGYSFLKWSIEAFNENATELLKFMRIYGYNFIEASNAQVSDAKLKSKGMPSWPQNGYVAEYKDYIIVKLGE